MEVAQHKDTGCTGLNFSTFGAALRNIVNGIEGKAFEFLSIIDRNRLSSTGLKVIQQVSQEFQRETAGLNALAREVEKDSWVPTGHHLQLLATSLTRLKQTVACLLLDGDGTSAPSAWKDPAARNLVGRHQVWESLKALESDVARSLMGLPSDINDSMRKFELSQDAFRKMAAELQKNASLNHAFKGKPVPVKPKQVF